jgi:hypothetical protein
MIKKSIVIFLIAVLAVFAASCQKTEDNTALLTEIESLKAQISTLTEENALLKETSGTDIDTEALLELRNVLDSNLYGALNALIQGDTTTALEGFTSTVEVKDGKLTSLYGKGTVEFIIPERPMNLRQRAFWQEADVYNAIYEIHDSGYSTPDERLNSLNVIYMKQDGVWKIDSIFIDE